jgi:polysaccharide export outer membrane protein
MRAIASSILVIAVACANGSAQSGSSDAAKPPTANAGQLRSATASSAVGGVPSPAYLIGPNDVLTVLFWRDKEMSGDVVVRPDGNITVPLLNDIAAAGLTPEQLRQHIVDAARHYIEDASATVVVKEIHSRNVFITGQVEKPGPYPLAKSMTVLQLIATAGGLKEFADGKNIVVMRVENEDQVAYRFDYSQLLKRKNLRQNIELKAGDTVVVP